MGALLRAIVTMDNRPRYASFLSGPQNYIVAPHHRQARVGWAATNAATVALLATVPYLMLGR
jgi:hypothetical protein